MARVTIPDEHGSDLAAQLREKEAELREVQRIARLGNWYWDRATGSLTGSVEFHAIYGLDPDRPFPEFSEQRGLIYTIESWERKNAAIKKTLRTGIGYELDLEAIRGDGALIWVTIRSAVVRDAEGKIIAMRGTVQDITERKRLEERLRESEARYRTVVENQSEFVCRFKPDGALILINKALCRFEGLRPEEMIGKNYFESLKPSQRAIVEKVLGGLSPENPECIYDIQQLKVSGEQHWIQWSTKAIFEVDGELIEYQAVGRDVTDRVRLEEELRAAKKAADEANRAKSQFLANMSHEIRTPMNGVLGMTELSLLEDISPRARDYLRFVRQSGKALLEIINNILDLAKIESGKVVLEHRPFRLREGLLSMLKPLSLNAQEKGLEFHYALDADVPDNLVGDLGRLRQVLTNLIGNAIKFTEKGAIRVAVEVDGCPEHPDRVGLLFRVKDDGIGIPECRLDDVFKAFSQVGLSSHVEFGGTGLGLSISKELVELMGGKIWANSQVDKGSTFYFTARFSLGEEQIDTGIPDPIRVPPALQPLKVLLAEDNPVIQFMTMEMLKIIGHSVCLAQNGKEALEALRREDFDIVLMDARMPEMDGVEATKAIRAAGARFSDIPIVAMTAHALKGDQDRFLEIGMDGYISKPFSMEELNEVMTRTMQSAGKTGKPVF